MGCHQAGHQKEKKQENPETEKIRNMTKKLETIKEILDKEREKQERKEKQRKIILNPLKPGVWERLVIPRGGAQRPPLQSQ